MTDNTVEKDSLNGQAETARQFSLRELLFLLLLLWALMPAAFLPLRALARILWERNKAENLLSTVMLSLYAKYFYSLGVATVCAAIAVLARNLPGGRELYAAARQRPWHACLAFMLFWSVLSTLFSGNPVSRFWGLRYHNDGLASYFIYAAVYVCALFMTRSDWRLFLLRTFTVAGAFCAIMVYWQVYAAIASGNGAQAKWDAIAVFFQINHCAYFFTMCILCAAGLWLYDPSARWRTWHLISFALQVYALLLNDTFGCFLAVLLALPMVCVFWFQSGRREALRPLVPCVLLVLLTAANITGILPATPTGGVAQSIFAMKADVEKLIENPEEGMDGGSGRVILWVGAVEQAVRHPVFGLGPDSPVLPTSRNISIRPHNEFLQHAMLLGFPGLAAYLAAIVSLLVYRWKRLKETDRLTLVTGGVVAGYLISSCFGITIFYTTPFFFLFLGLTAGYTGLAAKVDVPSSREPDNRMPPWTRNRVLLRAAGWALVAAAILPMETALFAEGFRERSDGRICIALDAYLRQVEDIAGADKAWFDVESMSLISADGPPPAPYGRGTTVNGKTYTGGELSQLRYNLEKDYRGCVLLVHVIRKDDAPVSFTWEWTRPEVITE